MEIHRDLKGNTWTPIYDLEGLKYLSDKENIFIWYSNYSKCGWTTPHDIHKVQLNDFLTEENTSPGAIWVLVNKEYLKALGTVNIETRKKYRKRRISDAIWGSIIVAFATIASSLITTRCTPTKPDRSCPDPCEEISPRPTIPMEPDDNGVWEWQDLTGTFEEDTIVIRVAFKIITDQMRWKLNSPEFLENGQTISEALPSYLSYLPSFEEANGIISVGLASEEGNYEKEFDLASRRADNLSMVINKSNLALYKNTYRLNLGQHIFTNSGNSQITGSQRRIILIGIMKWSEKLNIKRLEQCLEDALTNSDGLTFNLEKYSDFILTNDQLDFRK
ncbi:MAG: hypothetical protein Roseis2KO_34210 [Roseivirga sp.]